MCNCPTIGYSYGMTATTTMTDQQATDEAVLLLTRKLRRLHRDAYVDLMSKLPEGARAALDAAERRADTLRDKHTVEGLAYPVTDDDDEDDEY